MSQFEIEKNIAVPVRSNRQLEKYPFEQLAIGDSFFVPLKDGEKQLSLMAALNHKAYKWAIEYHGYEHGFKFCSRKSVKADGINEIKGVRFWRVQ